jgi:hypothetical protein
MVSALSESGSAYRSDIWRESWRPQQPLSVLGFRQQAYRLFELVSPHHLASLLDAPHLL